MVTLKQIADTVGVSTATVSRVLNFDPALSVTATKRQAIIEAAEALNYATPRARRARHNGLRKVALVHFLRPDQELIDPYYVGLRLGIESRCQALHCETVKAYHTETMPELTLLQSADGVIAIGPHDEAEVAWLKRYGRNVVFADFIPLSDEFDAVQKIGRAHV
jgi:LacI family transcriptional regulator